MLMQHEPWRENQAVYRLHGMELRLSYNRLVMMASPCKIIVMVLVTKALLAEGCYAQMCYAEVF